MPVEVWLDTIPLWMVFPIMVALVMFSIWAGYRLGLFRRRSEQGEEVQVGSAVAAMLALLGFLLAFTFGIAASRYDARKQLLLQEVNAIGTSLLRSELLPEPHASECQRLLTKYVELRVRAGTSSDFTQQQQSIVDSEATQQELWRHAIALAKASSDSEINALFIASLNELFDLHTSRVTVGLQYRIPLIVWAGLVLLSALSMASVGFQFGLAGRGSFIISAILAITFSLVVQLIADLDRASEGGMQVSQQPMIELHEKLQK